MTDPTHLLGRDPARALMIIKEEFLTDKGYRLLSDEIGNPTIRLLKPGTLKEYHTGRRRRVALTPVKSRFRLCSQILSPLTGWQRG